MKIRELKLRANQAEEIEGLSMEYPYVEHHANLKDTPVPWHWHEELELNYISNGRLKLTTPNRSYIFHKNEAFFINTNVMCTMESLDESVPAISDSHLFHSVFLGGHFKSVYYTKYLDPVLQNKQLEILEIRGTSERQQKILTLLRQLTYLQKEKDTEFQTRNLLSDIWLLLLKEIQETELSRTFVKLTDQNRIQTMMTFIQQNYSEKLSLEEIAASASVSKRECLRCFQNCIHKTPYDYLQDYRLEMAERLLRTTDMPIQEIAFQTGFSNAAYFGKVFKKARGITPGQYKKMHSAVHAE